MLVFRQLRFSKIFTSYRHRHNIDLKIGKSNNMNKAYFRHVNGEDNYDLTFIYVDPALNVNRQFNFTRQSSENVGTLLGRISTNVEKILTKKKIKKNKKSNANNLPVETVPVDVKLVLNGEEVSKEVICVNVFKENEIQLCVLDNKFNVIINAPTITVLSLPSSILAGFPVYPNKIEGFFLASELSKFQWYSAKVGEKVDPTTAKWEKVGEGFTHFTTTDDIGKRLKLVCVPGDGSQFGPEAETISTTCIEAGPGFCPFENRHGFTQDKLSGKGFRVVSYNILADLYCDSDFTRTVLHPYCPPYALQFDYRKQLIFKEILGYNSDIYCMQEVDCKVFDLELTPLLNQHSYEGVFTKKGALVAEGLACFFRSDRFKLLENFSCVLGEDVKTSPIFSSIWSVISKNEAFLTRLCGRATAAQAVILQSLDNEDEIVVVGNTHLYFHPDADHVRLTQGGITILWLQNIVEETKKRMPGKRISLLLCGDFNSVPSCGIYQLYTTGVAPSDLEDWKSNEAEAVVNLSLTQSLPLASACGTPEFTNYTVGFADCLDYIFHDRENLKVTQIVPLPSVEELSQHTALPSIVFPSDHIALIADLEFK